MKKLLYIILFLINILNLSSFASDLEIKNSIIERLEKKRKNLPHLYSLFTNKCINKMSYFVSSPDDIKDEVDKITKIVLAIKENPKEITSKKIKDIIQRRIDSFKKNKKNLFLMLLASKKNYFSETKMSNEKSLYFIIILNQEELLTESDEKDIKKHFHFILKNKKTLDYNKILNEAAEKLIQKIDLPNLFLDTENKKELKRFILTNAYKALDYLVSFVESSLVSEDLYRAFEMEDSLSSKAYQIKKSRKDDKNIILKKMIKRDISLIKIQKTDDEFHNLQRPYYLEKSLESYIKGHAKKWYFL